MIAKGWPASYTFASDEFCQKEIRSYVREYVTELENKYDLNPNSPFYRHVFSTANDVSETALELGLGKNVAKNLYWATLIHDMGQTDIASQISDHKSSATPHIKTQKKNKKNPGLIELRTDFIGITHPFLDLASDIIANHHTLLDTSELVGELSNPARLVAIAADFDKRMRIYDETGDTINAIPSVIEQQKKVIESQKQECLEWHYTQIQDAFYRVKMRQHEEEHKAAPQLCDMSLA